MKTIPLALLDAYGKPGTSTCFLVKLVTKQAEKLGFATLDRNVTFDDGLGPVTYSAYQELKPQKLQEDSTFEVDNTELVGWFSQAIENLVVAGKFDLAELTIYRVNYLRLERGFEVMAHGTVGQVSFNKTARGKRKVEFRGLMQQLKQTVNQLYSLTCRADFGDDRCGMPLVWETATVGAVGTNPRADLTLTGLSRPSGYFDLGVIEVTSGPNSGTTLEVERWAATGATRLTFLAPFPFTPGTTLRIRQDCDKTEAACIAYGNIVNMRAEHKTPVQDQGLMVPGAYIRSAGAIGGGGSGGTAPEPVAPVPLLNPEFNAVGGWIVKRQDGSPGFSYDTAAAGQRRPGVLRWQGGPLPSAGFDFGDIIENPATALSNGGPVTLELWVKAVALSGVTVSNYPFAFIGIQTYQDAACTIPIGNVTGGAEAQLRELGDFRLLLFNSPAVPAGRYVRFVVVMMNSATNATIHFDNAAWTYDPVGWATRGQP